MNIFISADKGFNQSKFVFVHVLCLINDKNCFGDSVRLDFFGIYHSDRIFHDIFRILNIADFSMLFETIRMKCFNFHKRHGISDFEEKNRSLAFRLFDGEELTPEQRERLDYMICSGTFGTAENNANIQIAEKGRWGYFLSWLHPSREIMMESFPVLREKPALTPVFRVWRLIRAFVSKDRDYRRQCRRARLRALLGLDGKNKS